MAIRTEKILVLAIFIILAAALAVRSFSGIDFTDEGYHLALAHRFALGETPFIDDFEIHQTAAFLYYPLVKGFERVVGSTSGVVLFMRVKFCWLVMCLAMALQRGITRQIGGIFAALVAVVVALFLASPIPDFNYNSLCGCGVLAAILVWHRAGLRSSGGGYLVCGLFAAMTFVAYPPMAFWVIFILGFIYLESPLERRLSYCLDFLFGTTLIFIPFFLFILRIGPGAVIAAIVKTNLTAPKLGGWSKLYHLSQHLFRGTPFLLLLGCSVQVSF